MVSKRSAGLHVQPIEASKQGIFPLPVSIGWMMKKDDEMIELSSLI